MASRAESVLSPSSVTSPPASLFSPSSKGSPGAAEAVRKAPFPLGQPFSFAGKTIYRPCRTGVFAPSDWDPALALRSSQVPKAELELEFVYGYAGMGDTAANLYITAEGHAVYFVAGVAIVYNRHTHTQKFFTNHNDDISSISLCEAAIDVHGSAEPEPVEYPPGVLVATGQVIPIVDGKSARPYVCIWDSRTLQEIRRFTLEPEERDVFAMEFSPDGKFLATISSDDYHTVTIWDWRHCRRVSDGRAATAGFGVVWDTFSPDCLRFCTFGLRALKMWDRVPEDPDQPETAAWWTGNSCSFGKLAMETIVSAVFLPPRRAEPSGLGLLLTGTMAGDIYVWRGRQAIAAVAAHETGPQVLVKGTYQYGGVRSLCLRRDQRTVLSGGADGFVRVWNVEDGTFREDRLMKMFVLGFAKESPPAVRAIASDWKGDGFVVGTNKCDLWQFQRDAKCLVYGHAGSLTSVAWHPSSHSVFATVSEAQRLNLFDASTKDLLRTCFIGFPANAVAISPVALTNNRGGGGAGRFANLAGAKQPRQQNSSHHVAVGGLQGRLKVVEEDTLAPVFVAKDLATDVEELRYSPDGSILAVAGRDQYVDLYAANRKYERCGRCIGHSSTVYHLDWSADGSVLQSADNSYEILYWNTKTAKQERGSQRDQTWATWTMPLGFPVMGIWPLGIDGTDINAVDRSHAGGHVVTSDDFGDIKLFNYPCVVEGAPFRLYVGHSSHIICVRFSSDDTFVVSAGGHDRALFQFRTRGIVGWTAGSDMDPTGGPTARAGRLTRLEQEMKSKNGEELVWGALDKAGKRWGYVRADGTAADDGGGSWGAVGAGGDEGPREMQPKLPPRQPKQAPLRPPSGLLPALNKSPAPPGGGKFRNALESDIQKVMDEARGVLRKAGILPKLDGSPGGYQESVPPQPQQQQQQPWIGAKQKPNRGNMRSARLVGGGGGGGGGAGGQGPNARSDRMRGSWDR